MKKNKQYLNRFRQAIFSKIGLNRKICMAKGSILIDNQDNHIVDLVAQFGAVPFGHNPDFIKNAIISYLEGDKPVFVQPLQVESTLLLAEKLCHLAGTDYEYVIFSNSGAETVEAAIKLARIRTKRRNILSTINSFHGKTYSALSATGSNKYSTDLIIDCDNYNKVEFNVIAD